MKQPLKVGALPFFEGETVIIKSSPIVVDAISVLPEQGDMQRGKIEGLPRLPPPSPVLLFRPLCGRHIDQGAHIFNEIAGLADNRVAYLADISELAAGR